MKIQCEKCHTVFNLDETRIPEGGANVRCSRCRHVFTAYAPPLPSDETATGLTVEPTRREVDKEIDDALGAIFEKEEPATAEEKNDVLDGDLDRAYEDPLQAVSLEEAEHAPSEKPRDLMDERVMGEEARLADDPEVDILPLETVDDRFNVNEGGAETVTQTMSKQKSSKWGVLLVFLLIILVVLGAFAAVSYFKPALIPTQLRPILDHPYLAFLKVPEKKAPTDAGVSLLEFRSVAGSFVTTEKSGNLFVIRGMVSSKYPKPRSYILIRGSILDTKGKVVRSATSYAGNTFTEAEISTLPLAEIKKAMQNRDGMARQNFNVMPGAAIPFMIVFETLPDNLSEFTVEAVSSSPGS